VEQTHQCLDLYIWILDCASRCTWRPWTVVINFTRALWHRRDFIQTRIRKILPQDDLWNRFQPSNSHL